MLREAFGTWDDFVGLVLFVIAVVGLITVIGMVKDSRDKRRSETDDD